WIPAPSTALIVRRSIPVRGERLGDRPGEEGAARRGIPPSPIPRRIMARAVGAARADN
ncbi:MAG: hypothetical protein AVDCRST_MAG88-4500, partial [uncultured Thermomicrobiales bacterium]